MDDFLQTAFNGSADQNLNLLNDLNLALRDDNIKIEPDLQDINFSKKDDDSSNSMFEFTKNSEKNELAQRTPTRMTTRSQLKRSRAMFKQDESDNEDFGEDDEYNNDSDSLSGKEIKAAKRSRSSRSSIIEMPAKKESNKEAASRYRMKKLSEKDRLFETKEYLEKQNDDVKKKIDHVQTEINYLKNIIVQMLLTKGVLSNLSSLKMVKPI